LIHWSHPLGTEETLLGTFGTTDHYEEKIDTTHREKVQMSFKGFDYASTSTSWWCHNFRLLKLIPTSRKVMKLPTHYHETKSTRILQKSVRKTEKAFQTS